MLRLSKKMSKGVTMSRKIVFALCLLVGSIFTLSAVTLDGVVFDAEAGEPVSGALVELHQGNMEFFETNTNEAGEFSFTDLEPGNYMLHIIAEEFLPYMEMLEIMEDMTITIELQNNNGGGELTGHLFGSVTNSEGEPLTGVDMVISTWNQNSFPHHQVYETVTGEAGNYDFSEIIDFADYEVMIMVGQPPFTTEVYVEGDTEFDIVVEENNPGEYYSLSGEVYNEETGEAIAGINILLHGWPGIMMEATSDEAGQYIFPEILEGDYELIIQCNNSGFEPFTAEIAIFEDTVFDIGLTPVEQGELSLTGLVIDAETGDIIPGVDIALHQEQWYNQETVSGEDGSYSFEGLFAGEYHLVAHAWEMEYYVFHADIEILDNMEFIIEMESFEQGELTLSGVITDEESGEPLPDLGVHLWADNIPGNMLTGFSNEEGFYEINNIMAGEYQLTVHGMQGMILYEDEIEITENMIYDIVIAGQPGDEGNLNGIVVNVLTGELVPGVHIILQHGWQFFDTFSGEAGQYSFQNIPMQNYQLITGAEGYHEFSAQIDVEEDTYFEIGLEPFAMGDFTLSGMVTDAETGNAVPGVHIQLFAENFPPYNTMTNEAGIYEISGIFGGTYQLMAWTNGWNQYEPFETTIEIIEDLVFDFEMQPVEIPGTGSITGTIYDIDTMEPISGAYLHIAPAEGNPGGWWNYYESISDETGAFSFTEVEEGAYILAAEAEGYLMSFFDGASNPEEATVLEVIEDEVLTVEMMLTPLVFHNVSGNVSDFASDDVLEGAFVRALMPGTGCNHWAIAEALSDEEGNFVLEVPQGEYIFSAEYGEPNNVEFMRQFYDHKQTPVNADIVSVTDDVSGIDFELALPENYDNHISGTITVEGSIPENPVLVAAVSGNNQWEAATVTDMFGNYILNNLPEEEFYILAYEYSSVPTYYPGVIDFEEAEYVYAQGNVTGIDFELILPESNGVYQVDGFVMDDNSQPVANANVIIMSENGDVLSYAVTNSQGYYQAGGLPSGNLTGLATKIHYNSDQEDINITTTGNADFVIIPQANTDSPQEEITPAGISLSNYPNPFNPTTTISFSLAEGGYTTLEVYNVNGQKIATLVQDELGSGNHSITWNGESDKGQKTASGVYFYRIQSGNYSATNKMIMMK